MENIKLDFLNAEKFVTEEDVNNLNESLNNAIDMIENKNGKGNDFLGWLDLPINYNKEEYARIKESAKYIRENSKALVVIGIGGSYLGARAVIEALSKKDNNVKIYYAGNNISSKYITELINEIKDVDFCINVISKSGTTTESAISFRIFRELLESKYSKEECKKRIFVTTDKQKGALKTLADKEGYETFVVPDDVGGRYSVLTAVGLLPICVAGIDTDDLIKGAKDMRSKLLDKENNDCYKYALIRNALYNKGKKIEVMVNYEPSLHYISEWWKQLFGESEGKEGKGIYPSSVDNTTDLHSLGQYIQQGERILFETVLNVEKNEYTVKINSQDDCDDGLAFLEGQTLDYINKKAMQGTIMAHVDGNVPNILVNIPKLNPYYIGQLIYFFEKACAISGYMLDINPFDQPGVEDYKRNMFKLLGKPGY